MGTSPCDQADRPHRCGPAPRARAGDHRTGDGRGRRRRDPGGAGPVLHRRRRWRPGRVRRQRLGGPLAPDGHDALPRSRHLADVGPSLRSGAFRSVTGRLGAGDDSDPAGSYPAGSGPSTTRGLPAAGTTHRPGGDLPHRSGGCRDITRCASASSPPLHRHDPVRGRDRQTMGPVSWRVVFSSPPDRSGPAAALWTDLWRSPTDLCTADRNLCTALGTTNYSTVVRGNPLSATDPRDTNDSRPSSEERFGTLRWTTSPT